MDHIEPDADGFIRCFYDPNSKRAKSAQHIADYLRLYAEEARKVSAEVGLGSEMPEVTPHDVLVALTQPKIRARGGDERSQREKKKNRKGANQ